MVQGFIGISTSEGDVNKLKESTGRVHAAIIGLSVVIFALLILRLVAVGILRLPGLN